jgi:hypothetical protein
MTMALSNSGIRVLYVLLNLLLLVVVTCTYRGCRCTKAGSLQRLHLINYWAVLKPNERIAMHWTRVIGQDNAGVHESKYQKILK